MIRRETFIALRARRQAYRIANDVLHPPFEPARPFQSPPRVLPLVDYQSPTEPTLNPRPYFEISPKAAVICVALLCFWIVAFVIVALLSV